MMAATVIIFGRTRSTAPWMIAARKSSRVSALPSSAASRLLLLQGVVEIDQHHHAGLGRHARQGDESHRHGRRQVEAQRPDQPQAARQARNGSDSMTISVSVQRRKFR